MVPLSSCTFNVCVSYAHFHFLPYKFQLNENAKALCLYCTDSKGKNSCVKAIQCDKLWYDFPVFIVSHYGEQAVSFEKVDLPESLQRVESRSTEIFQSQLVAREKHLFLRRGGLYNPSAPFSKRWQGNQLSQVRTL